MNRERGKAIVEALLLAAPEPLSAVRIGEIAGLAVDEVHRLVEDLRREYAAAGRGLAIREVAGGYQLVTQPDLAAYVEQLFTSKGRGLSPAALETLAIIAYRQPVTRAEIEAIRGVNAEGALASLLERGLIREVGRQGGPGRPILYGTTAEFLKHFGLPDLSALPEPRSAEGGGQAPGESA